jgi:hypothetical protein
MALVWMGHSIKSLREIRSSSVGTESSSVTLDEDDLVVSALKKMGGLDNLPVRFRRILAQYIFDMNKVLGELHRVLRPNGRAVFIVGDSTLRGVFVRNSRGITYLGQRNGLILRSVRRRSLPQNRRYLPPPNLRASGSQLAARMREEVVIKFEKQSK